MDRVALNVAPNIERQLCGNLSEVLRDGIVRLEMCRDRKCD